MNDLNEVNPDKIRLLTAFTILIHFIPMLHIYIPPENVRKPNVFWRFQGVYNWNISLKFVKFSFQNQIFQKQIS